MRECRSCGEFKQGDKFVSKTINLCKECRNKKDRESGANKKNTGKYKLQTEFIIVNGIEAF